MPRGGGRQRLSQLLHRPCPVPTGHSAVLVALDLLVEHELGDSDAHGAGEDDKDDGLVVGEGEIDEGAPSEVGGVNGAGGGGREGDAYGNADTLGSQAATVKKTFNSFLYIWLVMILRKFPANTFPENLFVSEPL